MIATMFSVVSLVFVGLLVHRGFPGSVKDIGWKMSGTWATGDRTFHVMMHASRDILRGHIVWARDRWNSGKLGQLVLKEMHIKPFGMWSAGTFIEPSTGKEYPVQMRLGRRKALLVDFGEGHQEEWKLIRSL